MLRSSVSITQSRPSRKRSVRRESVVALIDEYNDNLDLRTPYYPLNLFARLVIFLPSLCFALKMMCFATNDLAEKIVPIAHVSARGEMVLGFSRTCPTVARCPEPGLEEDNNPASNLASRSPMASWRYRSARHHFHVHTMGRRYYIRPRCNSAIYSCI